jgi:hypothetical protein
VVVGASLFGFGAAVISGDGESGCSDVDDVGELFGLVFVCFQVMR